MTPKPHIFERGEHVYIVTPVAPIDPGEGEVEHYAFAEQFKKMAPNEHLMWLRGQYVEAENANANGHVWTGGELAIKSLTPMFMPVTVMHDPRTAVGLIADTALKTPEADSVPRARIETTLGLWKHRFPEVCAEVSENYAQGSLMQSMECRSPYYTCCACGQTFPKLPDGSERANWCAHLREADGHAARILENVVFTGTGLIFGSRGAKGAFSEAHLDVFQEEVAEFHEKAKRDSRPSRKEKTRNMETIEIPRDEYAALQRRPSQEDFDAEKKRADEAEERASTAERKVEETETEAKTEKDRAEAAEQKVKTFEEDKAKTELATERIGKLGKGFLAKLGDFTKGRLDEQAKSLSDDDFEARLKELEELTSVKRDEGGSEETGGDEGEGEVSREETAAAHVGGGGGNGGNGSAPSEQARRSVIGGLRPKPAAKAE